MSRLQFFSTTEIALIIATAFAIIFSIILALGLIIVVPTEYNSLDETPGPPSLSKTVQFPYMVSLSVPMWIDEPSNERFYQCTGVILSENYVLTSNCGFDTMKDWSKVIVRAGSDYWSIGGSTHNVLTKIDLEDFIILNVSPAFDFNLKSVQKVNFSHVLTNWEIADAIGWDGEKTKMTYKYNAINVLQINKSDIENRTCNTEDIQYCDSKFGLGHVIIFEDNLVMMKTMTCDEKNDDEYYCGFKFISESVYDKLMNIKQFNKLWIIKK